MYLFVYGTLCRATNHPMHRLLASQAHFVGEATFAGKLFSLGSYPGVVNSADPTDQVWGEVYEMIEPTPLLARLDAYEDYFPDREAASLYLRRMKEVKLLSDNHRVEAWVYLYNRPVDGLESIASGNWMKR